MNTSLLPLEKAVLEKVFSGDVPLLVQFREQLGRCSVTTREATGFGFYTTLNVPESTARIPGLDFKFGDVVGEIPDLSSGVGFLIYVKDGIVSMLEGYSYDEPWPPSIDSFRLRYVGGDKRDLTTLNAALKKREGFG